MELLIAQAEAGDKRKNAVTLKELNAAEKRIAGRKLKSTILLSENSIYPHRGTKENVPARANCPDWNEKIFTRIVLPYHT